MAESCLWEHYAQHSCVLILMYLHSTNYQMYVFFFFFFFIRFGKKNYLSSVVL